MKKANTYFKLPILDGLELFHAENHKVDFPFHTHNTFNITLVLEQLFATKLPTKILQAPQGTIAITNPNEVHATICDNKIGNSFFTFYVSPDLLQELNHNKPVRFDNKVIEDQTLYQQLYFLSQNLTKVAFDLEKQLLAVLKLLVTQYAQENTFFSTQTVLFQEFLQEDLLKKFSLENSAKQFGLDKYKFLRLFKQETGLTPNNYIILKRVEQSKILLQQQEDLLDIALETGFYDATHFCKHFKKITGITPNSYRNA